MSNSVVASLGKRVREGLQRRWRRMSISIAGRAGRYERWRSVDWSRVERLVFVCSGNICRSPFAEKLALSKGIRSVSCGTTAKGGAPGDPTAVEIAQSFGIGLEDHVSNRVSEVDFSASDLIVVMDVHHLAAVEPMVESLGAQLTLLGLWDDAQPIIIADPFGCPPADFHKCFRRISACLDNLANRLNG